MLEGRRRIGACLALPKIHRRDAAILFLSEIRRRQQARDQPTQDTQNSFLIPPYTQHGSPSINGRRRKCGFQGKRSRLEL